MDQNLRNDVEDFDTQNMWVHIRISISEKKVFFRLDKRRTG